MGARRSREHCVGRIWVSRARTPQLEQGLQLRRGQAERGLRAAPGPVQGGGRCRALRPRAPGPVQACARTRSLPKRAFRWHKGKTAAVPLHLQGPTLSRHSSLLQLSIPTTSNLER